MIPLSNAIRNCPMNHVTRLFNMSVELHGELPGDHNQVIHQVIHQTRDCLMNCHMNCLAVGNMLFTRRVTGVE